MSKSPLVNQLTETFNVNNILNTSIVNQVTDELLQAMGVTPIQQSNLNSIIEEYKRKSL